VEKIVEIPLSDENKIALMKSVEEVKQGIQSLKELGFAVY